MIHPAPQPIPDEVHAGDDDTSKSSAADRLLEVLLIAAVAAPALVFRFATFRGEVVAVLYREPKRDAILVLGWLLIAGFFWFKARKIDPFSLSRLAADPILIVLSVLLGIFALTRLWVVVPANWGYEMAQYGLLFLFLLVLLVWTTEDPAIPAIVERALVASVGSVVAIGLFQGFWPAVAPPPINPYGEVGNPSLMGYKNPAALSVVAQIFILGGIAASARTGRRAVGILLWVLAAVEIFYIVGLQSRTAYTALAVGAATLAALRLPILLRNRRSEPRRRRSGTVIAVAVILPVAAAVGFLLHPGARGKAASIAGYAAHPAAYLGSDRGVYLRNTLAMVRNHPLGVGVGDWQTVYPVSRAVRGRDDFNDRFQVRRAHSDHVQILGEAGWPGLVLWWVFLGLVFVRSAVSARRGGRPRAAFLAAQVAAIAAAMCTDSFVETPYHKLQLFLVVFLVIAETRLPAATGGEAKPPAAALRRTMIALVSLAALLAVVTAVQTERKLIGAAVTESLVRRADAEERGSGAVAQLTLAVATGREWAPLPGHWKSLFRSELVLARAEALVGDRDRARRRVLESIRLYPFNPQALRFVATLTDDPREADCWNEAADKIEASTGGGFHIIVPICESQSADAY